MSLWTRKTAMLNRLLGVAKGVAVTYSRGAESASITAESGQVWVDRTAFASNDVGKARLEWGDRDYIVLPAAISAFGEPAEGDRVTETIDGTAVVFEVCRPDTGEPAYRWSDPDRSAWRLHVKEQAQ